MLHTFVKSLFSARKPAPSRTAPPPSDSKARGDVYLKQGNWNDAIACYRQAIEDKADDVYAWLNLGFALRALRRYQEARDHLLQAAAMAPDLADAFYLLGTIASQTADQAAAVEYFKKAHQLDPSMETVYADLCHALFTIGDIDSAREIISKGIALNPMRADFHHFRANLDLHQWQLDAAISGYQKALALRPDYPEALSNLGEGLSKKGRLGEAMAAFRQALALKPDFIDAFDGLLYAMSFDPAGTARSYCEEAARYGAMVLALARPYQDWPALSAWQTGRRLRVGMVSGDLCRHPVGYFLESVLTRLDMSRIELVAYPTQALEDDMTARLKQHFSAWTPLTGMSDEAAAQRIHQDGIHVLIDLAGHTSFNRLPLFAWKPAPVQASWLGYWASTGVPGIDYFLADPLSVPAAHRQHFTETVWDLPEIRYCFTAPAGTNSVTPPPALRNGHVTFGSYQNLAKLDGAVLALWERIFKALPNACLRLQSRQLSLAPVREETMQRLAAAGIGAERIELIGFTSREDYLASHAEVDIILDTFPFPGGTTTCEALWMGVPTVTLAGGTLVSRQGLSLLSCVGLTDWIAQDENEYVATAVAHASDVNALARLRAALRERALASPLFDAPRFARHLENALYGVWDKALQAGKAS